MIRVVIAGSRGFNGYVYMKKSLDSLLEGENDQIEIVSGHAKGADSLGEQYAAEKGYKVAVFKPDWKRYGRGAGMIRNQEMLDYACKETPLVVAFWDGLSKGTQNMIRRATQKGVALRVFKYDPE